MALANLLRHRLQPGQVAVPDRGHVHPHCVGADVDGPQQLAGTGEHRHRHRTQAQVQFLVDDGVARLAHAQQLGPQRLPVNNRGGRVPVQLDPRQERLQFRVRQLRQQHPPHGGVRGRQARAHRQADGHQPVTGRGADHVHHVIAVQHRQRGRLAQLRGDALQILLNNGPVLVRGLVGVPQPHHPGCQLELAPAALDETEGVQRQQEAAGLGPVHAGPRRHLTQGHARVLGVERLQHLQAGGQGADVVAVSGFEFPIIHSMFSNTSQGQGRRMVPARSLYEHPPELVKICS